jgi:cytochrome c oxidase cbb3-type subunit 3
MDLRALNRAALAGLSGLLLTSCGAGRPPASGATSSAPAAYRYSEHVFAGGVAPPGADATNPFAEDKKSATEGSKLFTSMNCDGCHGVGATGSWAPALNDGRWRYGGSDGAVYQTIFYGRPAGMPAFGGMLQPPLIWKLVTYLKSLPPPAAVPTQSW